MKREIKYTILFKIKGFSKSHSKQHQKTPNNDFLHIKILIKQNKLLMNSNLRSFQVIDEKAEFKLFFFSFIIRDGIK